MKRAKPIAASSLANVVREALGRCHGLCCDDEADADVIARIVCDALADRPEAVALREAWAESPTQCVLLATMRNVGGDREGELLGAAARLAGLAVVR